MNSERLGHPIVVMGAGLTGLSAAYHLNRLGCEEFVVMERQTSVGGLASTTFESGFSFDTSIHILYSSDSYVAALLKDDLLNGNIANHIRCSFCYSYGVYTEYPYQLNNYGLPPEVIAENLIGLLEVRQAKHAPPANFEEWIYQTFGHGIARNFMVPYNRRVWAWNLRDMSFDWIAGRVPTPELKEVILGALRRGNQAYGPNRQFWYPKRGGIQALAEAFQRRVPDRRLRLGTTVTGVDVKRRLLTLACGERIGYKFLITTIPVASLISMMGDDVPESVRRAAAGLKHNTVHTVNVGLRGERLRSGSGGHWIYFPEEAIIFHRISFPHRFSDWMVPPGCCSIQAEISESEYRPRVRSDLIQLTLKDLVRLGFLTASEARPVDQGGRVQVANTRTIKPAYVIYDLEHGSKLKVIKDYLITRDIYTVGRFGEWEYFNMDDSILAGRNVAEVVLRKLQL